MDLFFRALARVDEEYESAMMTCSLERSQPERQYYISLHKNSLNFFFFSFPGGGLNMPVIHLANADVVPSEEE